MSEPISVELLASHPFFLGMAASHLEQILNCSRQVEFVESLVLRQGEPAEAFYLIQEGLVALELVVPGCEPLVIETLGKGELVGASWLLPPYRVQFDVRSRGRVTAIEIDSACMRCLMEQDHSLGYEFYRRFLPVVADRLQASRLQLMDVYGRPADYVGAKGAPVERRGEEEGPG